MRELVESRSAVDVTRLDGGTAAAEIRVGDLVEEDVAEVDLGGGDEHVGNDSARADVVGVGAEESG